MGSLTFIYKAVISALVFVFLLGCVPSRVDVIQPLSEKLEYDSKKGVVVARVINASSYPLPFNQFTLTPDNFNESDKVKMQRLMSLTPQMNGATIFASEIKPGNYALSSIRSFYSRGNYWYSRFLDANATFGTFIVEPGKITDLGTVVFYPKPQEERYIELLLRLPEEPQGEMLAKHFSFYQFDRSNVITWDDDGRDDERFSLYASVAQNPVTFTTYEEFESGNIYFLSKLGVFLKRTPDGQWETDGIDTNLDLSAVLELDNGDLYIGSSDGLLFRKRLGYDWQNISIDSSVDIRHLVVNKNGYIDLIGTQDTRLIIMRSEAHQNEISWQVLNEYSYENFWSKSEFLLDDVRLKNRKGNTQRVVKVKLDNVNEQHVIRVLTQPLSHSPVFAGSDYNAFMYNPETWEISKFEHQDDISFTIKAGAVEMGVEEAGFWSWSGQPTYYLKEENGEWSEIRLSVRSCDKEFVLSDTCENGKKAHIKSFNLVTVPWFKTAKEGLVIASFSDVDFWSGQRSSKTKILKTIDGGQYWTDTGHELPKKYCRQLIAEVSDRLLISCNGATGDFYESHDEGLNWSLVRQHESF